jgi:hypothetical protein
VLLTEALSLLQMLAGENSLTKVWQSKYEALIPHLFPEIPLPPPAALLFAGLQEDETRSVGGHQIFKWKGQIRVFGNDRSFPVPAAHRLVDAYIGLVNNDPERSRMGLPEGRVDVTLPSGDKLAVGDVVPAGVARAKVETPLASGCSNWAGPCLVFEPVENTP